MNKLGIAGVLMSFPLIGLAQSSRVSSGEHGVLVAVSQKTVQVNDDGSTVTTRRALDVRAYAEEYGLSAVAPSATAQSSVCGLDGPAGVPPAGDAWPPAPPPGEPPNETQSQTTRTYQDGWTLTTNWGRIVTKNPDGTYNDGDWQQIGRAAHPPSGTNSICDYEEE